MNFNVVRALWSPGDGFPKPLDATSVTGLFWAVNCAFQPCGPRCTSLRSSSSLQWPTLN